MKSLPKPYYIDPTGITIYHADCREILPLLQKVDHIITDPPYEREAHTLQRRRWNVHGEITTPPPILFSAMDEETRKIISIQSARSRWCLLFCQIEVSHLWRALLVNSGLVYNRS